MSAAHKSENPAATGFNADQNTQRADSNSFRQHQATTIAQLAMKGHTVKRLGEGFSVSRWGLIRHCPDYAALVAFALMVGVSQ